MGEPIKTVDLEIHHDGQYCARGVFDVLWTNDLGEALAFLGAAVAQVRSSANAQR